MCLFIFRRDDSLNLRRPLMVILLRYTYKISMWMAFGFIGEGGHYSCERKTLENPRYTPSVFYWPGLLSSYVVTMTRFTFAVRGIKTGLFLFFSYATSSYFSTPDPDQCRHSKSMKGKSRTRSLKWATLYPCHYGRDGWTFPITPPIYSLTWTVTKLSVFFAKLVFRNNI